MASTSALAPTRLSWKWRARTTSFIPTLCHLDGLSDVGACRLCLVEVKNSPKLFPACVLKVEEGMEVTTKSDRLHALPADHPRVALCRTQPCLLRLCHQRRTVNCRRLAQSQGVTHVRLPYRNPKLRFGCIERALCRRSQPLHPVHALRARLRRDRRRPRVGRDGPRHRLDASLPISMQPWGDSIPAPRCGKCVNVCPTGALFDKTKVGSDHPKYPDFVPYLNMMREGNDEAKSNWQRYGWMAARDATCPSLTWTSACSN